MTAPPEPATPGHDDPPPFCACAHDLALHDDHGRCTATEPDPSCSCAGAREARRSIKLRRERIAEVLADA